MVSEASLADIFSIVESMSLTRRHWQMTFSSIQRGSRTSVDPAKGDNDLLVDNATLEKGEGEFGTLDSGRH